MALLQNVKRTIILNAGHWDIAGTPHIEDSGAQHNGVIEAVECIKIRDALVPVLEARGYKVLQVPDDLNLPKSIEWANKQAPNLNDALAIDIHLNYLSNTSARGTETFYGTSSTSKKIAEVLSLRISKALGIPNRGAKPDTQTAVGSLGWIRKTTMWASLVEICFLTNDKDILALRANGGYHTAAMGIANGVDELFGNAQVPVEPPEEAPESVLKNFTTAQLFAEISRRILGMGTK
jgi:N-acetylmuramoyl-L-alanine amidase